MGSRPQLDTLGGNKSTKYGNNSEATLLHSKANVDRPKATTMNTNQDDFGRNSQKRALGDNSLIKEIISLLEVDRLIFKSFNA